MPASLQSQRVLVTGAGGFIGEHLLRALHRQGAEPVAVLVAGKSLARLDALPFSVERIIVEDATHLGDAVRQAGARHVIHLSAHITTERSLQSLHQSLYWNVQSTIGVLTACTDIKAERVVLMGSCEEYGQDSSPFDTTKPTDPSSPYGASKAAATAYARMFYSSFKLPTVVLRPSVVYGPGQSPRMLISQVMKALAEGRVIDVTEGKQTRDFVYIDDVVEAILLALTLDNIAGEVWNVGSGEVVTVRDCLERIERISGRTGLIDYGGRPYIDREIFHYELEVTRTYNAFHWRPSVRLDEGLRRTWKAISQSVATPASGNT